jgi:ArsR family transcriptional regulator
MTEEKDLNNYADTLKALTDPNRLKILQILSRHKMEKKISVSKLADKLDLSQPNVSHHIKVLKHAGFLHCMKKDGCSYYEADPVHFKQLFSDLFPQLFTEDPGEENHA